MTDEQLIEITTRLDKILKKLVDIDNKTPIASTNDLDDIHKEIKKIGKHLEEN